MSETKKRNTHLPEFKARVGIEAVRGVKNGQERCFERPVKNVRNRTLEPMSC